MLGRETDYKPWFFPRFNRWVIIIFLLLFHPRIDIRGASTRAGSGYRYVYWYRAYIISYYYLGTGAGIWLVRPGAAIKDCS